jgi:hypothetical protein
LERIEIAHRFKNNSRAFTEDSGDFQKLKTCSSFLNLNHQTILTLSDLGEISGRREVELGCSLCTRWVVPELAIAD